MNIPPLGDLNTLDCLLRAFSQRPVTLRLEPALAELLQALTAAGLDTLPLPGQGRTLQRWQILARVAACDLALAKLYEGHTDALAILAECGAPVDIAEGIWGVWAAEPPDARARITAHAGERVVLSGRKAWCSGALQIDHALLTAWSEENQPHLVAITLADCRGAFEAERWQAVGMGETASVEIDLEGCPAIAIGRPGQYLSRPGFWHGGAGIAACWYGAAEALAGYLRDYCRSPRSDAHAHAHLGAVDVALYGARTALASCAREIDHSPAASAELAVRRVRAQVEHAAEQVIQHVGRALGATPFCRNAHFARLSADLPVYLRQSHAERDLAVLGQQVAELSAGAWQL